MGRIRSMGCYVKRSCLRLAFRDVDPINRALVREEMSELVIHIPYLDQTHCGISVSAIIPGLHVCRL